MTSSNLQTIAEDTFSRISDHLESHTHLDVDLQGTQLTISDETHQLILLTFHSPTHQVWVSSPLTGAHHFNWNGEKWVSLRTAISLNEILDADIRQLFNEIVHL